MNGVLETHRAFSELAAWPELRVGAHASLLVLVWRGRITEQSLQRLDEAERPFVDAQGRVSVLNVVTDEATGEPSVELIKRATATARRFDPAVRGSAVVILSQGYVAAATRATLDGLLILMGQSDRYRMLASVDAALEWLWRLPQQDARLLEPRLGDAVRAFIRESR